MRPDCVTSSNAQSISAVAERDGTLGGFLSAWAAIRITTQQLPLVPGAPTPTSYIDRIVVASRRRGGGVGRAFYADAQSYSELRYPQMACEVLLDECIIDPVAAVPWQLRFP